MCGPSLDDQQALLDNQKGLAQTFSQWAQQRYQGQTDTLNKLNSAYDRTLALGPEGLGMPSDQRRILESQAINRSAANYQNTARAVLGQASGRGGDSGLATGNEIKTRERLATDAAGELSNQQAGIGLADSEMGQKRYQEALAGKQALLSQYDPTQYSQLGSSANSQAMSSAQQLYKERQAASPWNLIGGLAKTGISAGLSYLTGGVSNFANPMQVAADAGSAGQGMASGMNTLMSTMPGASLVEP